MTEDFVKRVAAARQIDLAGGLRIWIPPTGRPYWVGKLPGRAGPDLTDEEIEQYVHTHAKAPEMNDDLVKRVAEAKALENRQHPDPADGQKWVAAIIRDLEAACAEYRAIIDEYQRIESNLEVAVRQYKDKVNALQSAFEQQETENTHLIQARNLNHDNFKTAQKVINELFRHEEERGRLEQQYPAGTADAEDAWAVFHKRETELLERIQVVVQHPNPSTQLR